MARRFRPEDTGLLAEWDALASKWDEPARRRRAEIDEEEEAERREAERRQTERRRAAEWNRLRETARDEGLPRSTRADAQMMLLAHPMSGLFDLRDIEESAVSGRVRRAAVREMRRRALHGNPIWKD